MRDRLDGGALRLWYHCRFEFYDSVCRRSSCARATACDGGEADGGRAGLRWCWSMRAKSFPGARPREWRSGPLLARIGCCFDDGTCLTTERQPTTPQVHARQHAAAHEVARAGELAIYLPTAFFNPRDYGSFATQARAAHNNTRIRPNMGRN